MATNADGPKATSGKASIDFIIKLGGSALTYKDRKETLNAQLFEPTLQGIVDCWSHFREVNNRAPRIVLVHGAGSFGHPHAKAGKVHLGIGPGDDANAVLHGFCDTRFGLNKLSTKVLDYLVPRGVPATLCSPFPSWQTKTVYHNGVKVEQSVVKHSCEEILNLVDQGLLPMLHGDCVLDTNQRTAILSGDLILDCLSSELPPSHVVYVSDVEGVFDRPPLRNDRSEDPDASLIPIIPVMPDGSYEMPSTSISCADVTGGMAGKLAAAATTASRGISVYIVKGGSESMQQACLGTIPSRGTMLRPQHSH